MFARTRGFYEGQAGEETYFWLAFVYHNELLFLSLPLWMNRTSQDDNAKCLISSCVISTIIQWTHEIKMRLLSITD